MPGADYDDAVNVLIQGITQLDIQEQPTTKQQG